jgi:transposase
MSRRVYPTDSTDAEWTILEPLVPPPEPGGYPAKYPRREVINAIRYMLSTGCAWDRPACDVSLV